MLSLNRSFFRIAFFILFYGLSSFAFAGNVEEWPEMKLFPEKTFSRGDTTGFLDLSDLNVPLVEDRQTFSGFYFFEPRAKWKREPGNDEFRYGGIQTDSFSVQATGDYQVGVPVKLSIRGNYSPSERASLLDSELLTISIIRENPNTYESVPVADPWVFKISYFMEHNLKGTEQSEENFVLDFKDVVVTSSVQLSKMDSERVDESARYAIRVEWWGEGIKNEIESSFMLGDQVRLLSDPSKKKPSFPSFRKTRPEPQVQEKSSNNSKN